MFLCISCITISSFLLTAIVFYDIINIERKKGEILLALVKPNKVREEMYDAVVRGLEKEGFLSLGRSKEGLVYKNEDTKEFLVVKVIKKKGDVPQEEINVLSTYEEKMLEYEEAKEEKEFPSSKVGFDVEDKE